MPTASLKYVTSGWRELHSVILLLRYCGRYAIHELEIREYAIFLVSLCSRFLIFLTDLIHGSSHFYLWYLQDYVATRWYRAPELCGSFFSKVYSFMLCFDHIYSGKWKYKRDMVYLSCIGSLYKRDMVLPFLLIPSLVYMKHTLLLSSIS